MGKNRIVIFMCSLFILALFVRCTGGVLRHPGDVIIPDDLSDKSGVTDIAGAAGAADTTPIIDTALPPLLGGGGEKGEKKAVAAAIPCSGLIRLFPEGADIIATVNAGDENGLRTSPAWRSFESLNMVQNFFKEAMADSCVGVNVREAFRCAGVAVKFKEASSGERSGAPSSSFPDIAVTMEGPDETLKSFLAQRGGEFQRWKEEARSSGKLSDGVLSCTGMDGKPKTISLPDAFEGVGVTTLIFNPYEACRNDRPLLFVVSVPNSSDRAKDRVVVGVEAYVRETIRRMASSYGEVHRFGKILSEMQGQVRIAADLVSPLPKSVSDELEGMLMAYARGGDKLFEFSADFDQAIPKLSYDLGIFVGGSAAASSRGMVNLEMADMVLVMDKINDKMLDSCLKKLSPQVGDSEFSKSVCCRFADDVDRATLLTGTTCDSGAGTCDNMWKDIQFGPVPADPAPVPKEPAPEVPASEPEASPPPEKVT